MSFSESVHVFLSGALIYKRSKFFIMMGGNFHCVRLLENMAFN